MGERITSDAAADLQLPQPSTAEAALHSSSVCTSIRTVLLQELLLHESAHEFCDSCGGGAIGDADDGGAAIGAADEKSRVQQAVRR